MDGESNTYWFGVRQGAKVDFEGVLSKNLTETGLEPAISWFVVRRDTISPHGLGNRSVLKSSINRFGNSCSSSDLCSSNTALYDSWHCQLPVVKSRYQSFRACLRSALYSAMCYNYNVLNLRGNTVHPRWKSSGFFPVNPSASIQATQLW